MRSKGFVRFSSFTFNTSDRRELTLVGNLNGEWLCDVALKLRLGGMKLGLPLALLDDHLTARLAVLCLRHVLSGVAHLGAGYDERLLARRLVVLYLQAGGGGKVREKRERNSFDQMKPNITTKKNHSPMITIDGLSIFEPLQWSSLLEHLQLKDNLLALNDRLVL